MAFTSVCPATAVIEGGMRIFQVGKKSVLLVWPAGGELKAYRARCPHADLPLNDATFDGQKITCTQHNWGFDCGSGKCVTHYVPNSLHRYEVRVDGDDVLVDLGPARPAR
ncbi:MAG TPA: Rieske 2Fe-2S domain-containing protein [Polyangiaceae bacterium]|nr:Rieske 2Fe-2S domain-containing protein [Polyangiaceae bacterium]